MILAGIGSTVINFFLAEVSGKALFALAGEVLEASSDTVSVSAADFRREQTRRSRAQFR